MNTDVGAAFAEWYVRRIGAAVQAMEAAAFAVAREKDGWQFKCLAHLRPERASDEVMTAARKAFMEIATPCLEACRDGAIQLRVPDPPSRFAEASQKCCLVVRIVKSGGECFAVAQFIVDGNDLEEAKAKLRIAQLNLPAGQ